MRLRSFFVLAAVGLTGCTCLDGGSGGGGGGSGGGGSKSSITYDLVEMTGEFNVSGTNTSGTCMSVSKEAKVVLSLAKPDPKTVTFVPKQGQLSGYVSGTMTLPPTVGTTTCGTSAPTACPSFAEMPYTGEAFLGISTDPVTLGASAAPGVAFVPVLGGPLPRALCDKTQFEVSNIWARGKPVTVAQLLSGRFVVEASGTTPLVPPATMLGESDPQPVQGTLSYSYRLVFQTSDYDPKNAVAPIDLPSFDQCLTDLDPTADDDQAAEDAFDAGATDIPLNASGCRRLKVTRDAGSLSLAYELTKGTRLVFDAASGATRAEADRRVLYAFTEDDTGIHESFDTNEDGTFDRTVETTFDAGVWAATVSTEAGPNPKRVSRIRASDTTMVVREERGGTVLDEFVTSTAQGKCFGPNDMQADACKPPPGPPPTCTNETPMPCSKAVSDALRRDLTKAVAKGRKCLKDTGLEFDPSAKVEALSKAGKLKFFCTADPCGPLGEFKVDPAERNPYRMDFNTARNSTPAERARTLFHETFHSDPIFNHDDELNRAASNACKLQITDRTFACETMCFNPQAANKCVCIRCLSKDRFQSTDAICKKCDGLPDCSGRVEGGKNVSQAIGAWCGRGKVFCDTKTECDTACASIGGGCKQVKATCDAGCN